MDKSNIERADNFKRERDIARQKFIEQKAKEGISPVIADEMFSASLYARLSRSTETLIRNGEKWDFNVLCNSEGEVIANTLIVKKIGKGKTKVWRLFPEWADFYGKEFIVSGKNSYEYRRLNFHIEKRSRPAKIVVERGHVKIIPKV